MIQQSDQPEYLPNNRPVYCEQCGARSFAYSTHRRLTYYRCSSTICRHTQKVSREQIASDSKDAG